ncbi:TRAP transporter small permease [Halomonas sp.]|uniref:TRAP transporter small permease n=1 Tax=Halomonas sp. TaxID=1486246 RepID=UPI003A8F8664
MQHSNHRSDVSPTTNERGVIPLLGRFANALSNMAAGIAVFCMGLMTTLILVNILVGLLSRFSRVFPTNLAFAWEYAGYLMGVAFLMGMALALKNDRHIRLKILVKKSNRTLTFGLELFCTLIGALVCAYLTYTLFESSYNAWLFGRLSLASLTPLWIPKAGLALGAAVLTVQMLVRLLFVLSGRLSEDSQESDAIKDGL